MKRETTVFVALPNQPKKNSTKSRRNPANSYTRSKHNSISGTLPRIGTGRTKSKSAKAIKGASHAEWALLIVLVMMLAFISVGKVYVSTKTKAEQQSISKMQNNMNTLLLSGEKMEGNTSKEKTLKDIEKWAVKQGMIKRDPREIILVK